MMDTSKGLRGKQQGSAGFLMAFWNLYGSSEVYDLSAPFMWKNKPLISYRATWISATSRESQFLMLVSNSMWLKMVPMIWDCISILCLGSSRLMFIEEQMELGKLRELVRDREAWCAVVLDSKELDMTGWLEMTARLQKQDNSSTSAAKIDALVSFCHEPAKQGKYYFPKCPWRG